MLFWLFLFTTPLSTVLTVLVIGGLVGLVFEISRQVILLPFRILGRGIRWLQVKYPSLGNPLAVAFIDKPKQFAKDFWYYCAALAFSGVFLVVMVGMIAAAGGLLYVIAR